MSSNKTYPWILCEIANEVYGLSCENVTSIVILDEVTPMPNSPDYVRGVINLRGQIVKVLDLRVMLDMKSTLIDLTEMDNIFMQRKQDHINWLNTLEKSVLENTVFPLTTNPHACAFGKWYDSFHTENIVLRQVLKKFDEPHKKIHSIAVDVKKLQEDNDFSGAKRLIEHTKNNELQSMMYLFSLASESYRESKREIVIVLDTGEQLQGIIVDKVVSVETLIEENDNSSIDSINNSNLDLRIGKRKSDNSIVVLLNENSLLSNYSIR